MTQIIASLLGYSLIVRASAAIIGFSAGILILHKHWPIRAKYKVMEGQKTALPPPPDAIGSKKGARAVSTNRKNCGFKTEAAHGNATADAWDEINGREK